MTTLMIILIIAGVLFALAGLAVAAFRGYRFYKRVKQVSAAFDAELQVLTAKQELVMQKAEKLQTDQVILNQRIEELKKALTKVGILSRELASARARFSLTD